MVARRIRIGSAAPAAVTWNASDKHAELTLSNGDLTVVGTTETFRSLRATASRSTGKYYCEFTIDAVNTTSDGMMLGIANSTAVLTTYIGQNLNGISWAQDSGVYLNAGNPTLISPVWAASHVVSMAVDLDAERIWWLTNGGSYNQTGADPAAGTGGVDFSGTNAGPFFPAATMNSVTDQVTVNFGATAYSRTPPTGFGNW